MEKLTLKELAPYLPYGVEVKTLDAIGEIVSIIGIDPFIEVKDYTALDDVLIRVASDNFSDFSTWGISQIKPILRPLSDLTEEIEFDGEKFVPIRRMLEENNFDLDKMDEEWINSFAKSMIEVQMSYDDAQMLLDWKFDIFGLLDKNLAVPVTENFNPYK